MTQHEQALALREAWLILSYNYSDEQIAKDIAENPVDFDDEFENLAAALRIRKINLSDEELEELAKDAKKLRLAGEFDEL